MKSSTEVGQANYLPQWLQNWVSLESWANWWNGSKVEYVPIYDDVPIQPLDRKTLPNSSKLKEGSFADGNLEAKYGSLEDAGGSGDPQQVKRRSDDVPVVSVLSPSSLSTSASVARQLAQGSDGQRGSEQERKIPEKSQPLSQQPSSWFSPLLSVIWNIPSYIRGSQSAQPTRAGYEPIGDGVDLEAGVKRYGSNNRI